MIFVAKGLRRMAEYHVSAGIAGIYAGKTNKNGTEWLDKSEVTDEALGAVRDYLVDKLQANNKIEGGYEWNRKDGKVVELLVRIREGENDA